MSSSSNRSSLTTGRVTRSRTSNTRNQDAAHSNHRLVREAQSSNSTSRVRIVSRRGRSKGRSSMTGEAVPLVERLHRSSETTAPDNRQSTIQLVDLVTPQAPSVRVNGEPLEVDLTYDDCDDQSELYLLLEDVVPCRAPSSDHIYCLGPGSSRPDMLWHSNVSRPTAQSARLANHTAVGHKSAESLHVETLSNADARPTVSQASTSQGIRCPICFDTLSEIKQANRHMQSTTCGHVFCGPCIEEVIHRKKQCPTCRQDISFYDVHPIFI